MANGVSRRGTATDEKPTVRPLSEWLPGRRDPPEATALPARVSSRPIRDTSYEPMSLEDVYELIARLLKPWESMEAVRGFVAQEAAGSPAILWVLMDRSRDIVDLLFVVEGDLYEGESAVLPIMTRLRQRFPTRAFDELVLPASHYNERPSRESSLEILFHRG